ncbi:MAG: hypothetical protein GYB34_15445 [Gammaproteobacteria bacterium]|nr:hypothetical protein [Gammaproteobacteria bacterium]
MDTRKADIAAMIGRGAAGALPLLGPMLSELINDMIPNQRLERLWNLFNSLESKVNELEKEKIEQKINDPKSIDLFEDACHQATRALSPERTEKIASLLKITLTKEQLDFMESKRLFAIFAEVNDAQIIILKYHGLTAGRHDFREQHNEVLATPSPKNFKRIELAEKQALYDSYRNHLVSLGLLRHDFEKVRNHELPQIDSKTGMQKSKGYKITPLGKLLIESVGVSKSDG